jgi:hypothetical protein
MEKDEGIQYYGKRLQAELETVTMDENKCLYCQLNDTQVPLIDLSYRGSKIFICPQHLPILIHKPEQLAKYFSEFSNLDDD